MPKIISSVFIFLFSIIAGFVSAHYLMGAPNIVYSGKGNIQINNPEISQSFYDNLNGKPRDYFISSGKNFQLYINLLVPEEANREGRYSANIFSIKDGKTEQAAFVDGSSSDWQEFYEPFDRDYYLKGPEFSKQVPAGEYKIEIFSDNNFGGYVLSVGEEKSYSFPQILNMFWQLPLLKITFFKTSVWQFFLTIPGITGIGFIGFALILLALIYYFVGLIRETIKHNHAKTLLLTSKGMQMREEIVKLLQKPAYDVTVGLITTAAKPEENLDYLKEDMEIMKEVGFNVEEIDIEGKTESQVMKLLELKDIIYVAGGNTFYLLKAMRACKFEKVIRKLLKQGKVYIGYSAGSIVAGRTIKTAAWFGDENIVGLKSFKGLNLVPFDIFVHYTSEYAEIIKKKIKNPGKRAKNLKILTDDQAILVQAKEVDLIGKGEAVVL